MSETQIDPREIVRLESKNDLLNQIVGELRTSNSKLQQELRDKEKTTDKVIIKTRRSSSGPYGGYTPDDISYKNLDDVVEDIRKTESKKLKVDTAKLEEEVTDLELHNDKLAKKLNREIADRSDKITESKKRLKDLYEKDHEIYEKELEENQKRISDLKEEINKIKADKTDKQLAEKRKEEIIDLKSRVKELNEEVEKLSSINIVKKAWNKFTNFNAKKAALLEKETKEEDLRKIKAETVKDTNCKEKYQSPYTYNYVSPGCGPYASTQKATGSQFSWMKDLNSPTW